MPADFTITEMQVNDLEAVRRQRNQSWLDTYVNEAAGVTEQAIRDFLGDKQTPAGKQAGRERFIEGKQKGTFMAWVAKDVSGTIIGSTTPFVEEGGRQRVGSIYVDKAWLGKGIGAQLMRKVIDWHNPAKPIFLTVATYNERAKAFYRKWGFEGVVGSERMYKNLIPEITMVRKASNDN